MRLRTFVMEVTVPDEDVMPLLDGLERAMEKIETEVKIVRAQVNLKKEATPAH